MNGLAWMCVVTPLCLAADVGKPLSVRLINDESIAQMRKQYSVVSAEVDDPVYKRKQQYEGFRLRDVLKDLSYSGHPQSDVYVRFRCKDGYLPIMPLSRALEGEGLIAIRDLRAPAGMDWEQSPEHGASSTPAPSYLVWASPLGGAEEYPWPYQMVAIELIPSADALGGTAPTVRGSPAMTCS